MFSKLAKTIIVTNSVVDAFTSTSPPSSHAVEFENNLSCN